jgi:hypothetical protein
VETLILDSPNRSLTAVMSAAAATVNPDFTSHYGDTAAAGFRPWENNGTLSGVTAVTLVPAPGAGAQRLIRSVTIYNADSAAVTVTVRITDGATHRIIARVTLAVGDTWTMDGTYDSNGSIKHSTTTVLTADDRRTLVSYCEFCYHSVALGWQLVNRFYLDTALGMVSFNLAAISAWIEETDVTADSDVQWQVRVHLWDSVGVGTHDETLTVALGAAGGVQALAYAVVVATYDRMDIEIQAANGAMKPPRCVNIGVEARSIVYA